MPAGKGRAGQGTAARLLPALAAIVLANVACAEAPDTRMDRLLATFPAFEDAQLRKEELPAIMEVWRDAQACVAAVKPNKTDLGPCVERVHEACLGRMGSTSWSADRDCWDIEIFAWMLLRQDARENLIARVEAQATASPEFFPKLSDDEDYSAAHLTDEIRRYDLEADQFNEMACGIDVGLMGYDPERQTIPLTAIDRSYSCGVEAQASVLRTYLGWLPTF